MERDALSSDGYLIDQALALRHLPPGTAPPRPLPPPLQRLLSALLPVPDDVNPLLWLRDHQLHTCAAVVRDRAVRLAIEILTLHRSSANSGADAKLAELFGSLLSPESDVPLPKGLAHDIMSEEAEQTLDLLRRAARLAGQPATFSADLPSLHGVLADLLRLAPRTDSVAWLAERRPGVSAWLALHLLVRTYPPPPAELQAGRVRGKPLTPRADVRSAAGLRVTVDQLSVKERCCALQLRCRFRLPQVYGGVPPRWTGFTRVSDDRGYHYLVRAGEGSLSAGTWYASEKLSLLAFPAPAAGARLTWESRPAVLTHYALVHGLALALPAHGSTLGDIAWAIQLPA